MLDFRSYLERMGVRYMWSQHDTAYTAQDLAHEEHISGERVVKPVLIQADGQFVLCALPASYYVDLEQLCNELRANNAQLELTFQAGTHQDAVTMSAADYIKLTQPMIGHFARHKH